MKRKITSYLVLSTLVGGLLSFACLKDKNSNQIDKPIFAKPGMVAYAASYSSDITNEPKYTTQNSTTFQYLNLGSTLDSYRGDSVKVGIIDSGINYDHEDFMVSGSTKVKGDSKYYSYQSSSWVYYKASQHGYSYIDDTLGHGTNVAATVAAAINSVGGLGLAPNVELYVYKVTNSSNGYEFGAIQNALTDAKTLGLDVINMSFQSYENAVSYGGSSMAASSGCSTILSYYLNQAYNAGITLVGAAGNYNTDEPSYPGSNSNVINVGSLNSTGTGKAGFSNYGSTIDLVAPGYVYVADEASNTAYTNTQGTSFSAPLVTAAIALYIQKNPSATPAQIESALYASCDEIDDSSSPYTNWAGHGSLNVAKFLGVQEDAPSEIVVNNPEVVDEELSLELGDTFDLSWTVNGSGTFDHSVNIYPFEDNGVLSVDNSGHITALSEGSDYVVIESVVDPNIYASIYVTVTGSVTPSPTLTSISINTSPSKTSYIEGNYFDPTGLVINRHYSDSSSDTYSYAGHTSEFTFSPSTSTSLTTSPTSVSISYGGCSCSQSISVASKSLTSITLSGEYQTKFNKGDTFNHTGLVVTANYNNGTSSVVTNSATFSTPDMSTAGNKTITVTYGGQNATYNITVTNTSTVTDTLTRATTGVSGTSYTSWSGKSVTSDAVYAGQSAGPTSGNGANSIQLRSNNNNSGIITTASAGICTKISVVWHDYTTSGRTINIYGKSTAYSSPSDLYGNNAGTLIGSITKGTSTELVISGEYEYIGIRSSNGALYLTSVTFTWSTSSVTLSSITVSGQATSFVEGDTFTFGGTVTGHYSDDSSKTIDTGYNVSSPDMTQTGVQEVTVSYGNCDASYNITVNQGTISSMALSGMTTEYVKGASFSFDGTCTITFANNYQKVVTPTSVTSPNMSTGGVKTITVTYSYNGKTLSSAYDITVTSYRAVYEYSESVLGTVTYPNNTQTISVNTLSVTTSGYKNIESNSIRLGSGSNTGSVTVTSTTSNIYKVVVSAKSYGSDSNVHLTIGGTDSVITSSYSNYTKEYDEPTNSCSISTIATSKRAYVQSITVYTMTLQDIGHSEDCVGLESFITNYMHMDYVDNLGYCKDSEHHYYATAKAAFNSLNEHQRSLFTGNSAYSQEYARLSAWASANGESFNSSNLLGVRVVPLIANTSSIINNSIVIVMISVTISSCLIAYFIFRKRKNND